MELMKMQCVWALGAVAAILVSAGCESDPSPPSPTSQSTQNAPPAPLPDDSVAVADTAEQPAATDPAQPSTAPQEPATPPAVDAAGSTERAQVGVGVKGRDYGGPGFVTTPIETYFRTGERISFEIQIPNAMKLYKAEHNNKGPKTHEEFMKVIIQENAVQLPDLPEGDSFLYVPETEELLVKHPAPPQPE